MGRRLCRRSRSTAALLFFLILSVILAARSVDGSRGNRRPGMGAGGRLFGGYELPRAKLIPPSGPSERHNSVGPELEFEHQQRKP
jgi:hypothetical protein